MFTISRLGNSTTRTGTDAAICGRNSTASECHHAANRHLPKIQRKSNTSVSGTGSGKRQTDEFNRQQQERYELWLKENKPD
jgi:hypothetical protein